MSLLLDALRPESTTDAVTEPEEEPLDAHATLELLAPKAAAKEVLTLEPTADSATAAPASAIAAPEPVAEPSSSPPMASRGPSPLAERVSGPAAPQPDTAARTSAPPLDDAALGARRMKRYGLLLVAIMAAVGIATVGKDWWRPSSNTVSSPGEGATETQPPAAPIETPPTPASIHAVQVSSSRPADRFAYTGDAPEIDLRTGDTDRVITSATADGMRSEATASPARAVRPVRTTRSTLMVTRAEGLSPVDGHVQAGYRALGSGDVANAQTEYLAALELDPNNVDALMGAATVAARGGKAAVAAQRYATVLKLEPGNPDATAGMTMLHRGEGAGESEESRLKFMIATDASRPALHAALAGVYAADGRWTEAAQEYFTALGKDPGNPDLAFNVAASLDQNRNAAMALAYYRQALVFARQRPAQIDLRAVEQRINQLSSRIEAPQTAAEAP
ncbi:MAG TPA: tetratricopeptide repeat protein [Steroidobacteraceae bacterium]|nr:tetratricopeptide repeat protein [Steroidobacteraceae bacterium]